MDSTLNLVPIDWLVEAMTDLIASDQVNNAYNLANPSPSKLAWQFDVTFRLLGIKGIGQCDCLTGEAYFPPGSVLLEWQDKMYHRLGRYRPYVTHEDPVSCDALGGGPPEIDEDFLKIMLEYAMSTRFGHQQLEQTAAAL